MNIRYLQQGVTLLEFIITLTLLTIMIALASFFFDGDRQRAEALLVKAQEVKVGLERFYIDYPCGLLNASGLVRPDHAIDNICGTLNDIVRWNGPYINLGSAIANNTGGNIDVSSIFNGVEIALVYEVSITDPDVVISAVELLNVPSNLRSHIDVLCPSCRFINDTNRIALIVRESTAIQTTDLNRYRIRPFGFNP